MINKFVTKGRVPIYIEAVQYDGNNKDELVQFFENREYYEINCEGSVESYIHFKKDHESWIRVGKYDYAIKELHTGEYNAMSASHFFENYKVTK